MNNFHDLQKKANSTGFSEILKNSNAAFAHRVLQLRRCGIKKKTKTEKRAQEMEGRAKTQQTTNKASIGRKAALGLRQIAALMAPSVSTQSQSLLRAPSCRQCGNFLHLSNVSGYSKELQHKRNFFTTQRV